MSHSKANQQESSLPAVQALVAFTSPEECFRTLLTNGWPLHQLEWSSLTFPSYLTTLGQKELICIPPWIKQVTVGSWRSTFEWTGLDVFVSMIIWYQRKEIKLLIYFMIYYIFSVPSRRIFFHFKIIIVLI